MKKKNQRLWLGIIIAACMVVVVAGGLHYVSSLRNQLTDQAVNNVLTVTAQQQQAFDNFIAGDQERLHSFAQYFASNEYDDSQEIRQQLTLFDDVDAVYSVLCLDEGWFCSNRSENIRPLTEENLAVYSSLTGSGIRDSYEGIISGDLKFGYYESFTFASGHKGVIQKSYDRSRVSGEFSLSFYNDRGLAYVVNQRGDILLHSNGQMENLLYDNIFDLLTEEQGEEQSISRFMNALEARETGSMIFTGNSGSYIYTYVPMENVKEWALVSIVPLSAITEETDQILLNSQQAVLILTIILAVCAAFLVLIWRTQKDIKEKDREIEYQEELFSIFSTYLANNSDDICMIIDAESGQAEYISPNVERVLGIPIEQAVSVLTAPGEAMDSTVLRAMEPGTALESINTEHINQQTGEHKWFQENAYCTRMQDRRKVVAYIADRTQDRITQNNLSDALKMAQAANQAKSAFLSSVSHDIRTPMNAIIGFVALLREEASDPELVLEYTQRIDAASQHLLGLINDVLDMNKIESGSATLNISEMNLAEVIDEINTIIRPQAKARNQTFEIFAAPLKYEHLQGDKLRVNQILINLLSNAVKYTQEGGQVELRIEELSRVMEHYSRVRFTIKDNGMGMSEEYQKVIFDPFTREETSATKLIQGTGLGMAITKNLVDLMGGTIEVESMPGQGSTFIVELELYIQEREDDPNFWTNYKIARMIVADDDEEVCRNIVHTMSTVGVVTDYATSGAAAIQMMRENREAGKPYDLILLDWKMPDLDGMETARLIRKNYPEKIPILLLTAYDWGEIEQEAKEIGVSHFMPKPFFMSTFKDAIRGIMGGLKRAEVEKESVIKDKRILVVDDIEVNRIILVKILNTLGAQCDVAKNGQEAVEKFEGSQPGEYDIILMDVQMPVMDGYAATRAIRSCGHPLASEVPIIAMTANAFVDDVRDAIASGMDAHVAKPIQVDKLKEAIGLVLASRKQRKAGIGE